MRYQGQISEWNDERGFGFVRPQVGTGRIFVHISAFPPGSLRPSPDDIVRYGLGHDNRGRLRATNVTYIVKRQLTREQRLRVPIFATMVALTFLVLVGLAVIAGSLHRTVIVVYVFASIVTYKAYADDKRAALTGHWRTKERTLHLLGLAGGWPGGLIAQYRFRHKTKKVRFQVAYWLTIGLNCAGLLWLHPV